MFQHQHERRDNRIGPEGRTDAGAPSENFAGSFKAVNWGRLFGYLSPYRGRMALATVALLLSTGLGLSFPAVIVRQLDSVTRTHALAALDGLAGLLIGIFALQAAFSFLQSYLLANVGERVVYDLRTRLYTHLQELSLDFYGARRVGDLVSRLSSDVTQMRAMLTTNVTMLLSQALTLAGSIAIVMAMNARFATFILALVPPMILIAFAFGGRIQQGSTRIQDQLAASTVIAEEGLQGIRVVKSFGREAYETQRYNGAMARTYRASLRLALYNSSFTSVMMFLGFASIAAIMWFGGREVIAGRLSLAMITGFLMYGISIATSLGGLGGLFGQLSAAVGGVQRVFELLDTRPTVLDAPGAGDLTQVSGQISIEDVSFSYPGAADGLDGGAPVLQGVSLEVKAGEIVALVGPSGAGKSTVLNLISRFYDPGSGAIRVDGHDLRSVTQASLHDQVGIVPQDTLLFGGTIRENILYGRLDATDDEVIAAARAANAHEFILGFPKGYETVVGERGLNLSGGQRQRIAIARAI